MALFGAFFKVMLIHRHYFIKFNKKGVSYNILCDTVIKKAGRGVRK